MDKKTHYIIICILSIFLGVCLRYISSKVLYYSLKKEAIEYIDHLKELRIILSERELRSLGNEKSKTFKIPLSKDITETYGTYFNPNYIWKDGEVQKNKNVIQDGLSAFVISMAITHSMQGNDILKETKPCKIYLGDDFSIIVKERKNKHDSLCLVLRNSDGKILCSSFRKQ